MSLVVWIALGLAAGFVGSRLVNKRERGVPVDVWVGVAGAVAAGWLFYAFGPPSVNGLNLFSDFAALIGSLVFLLTYYAIRRG
jgi:uncharacterized membrane protein YeaQ/YmgE (transglycosylase-associated protein family)